MPQIHKQNQQVTQITVVESEPGKQEEALALMVDRAHFMARQPGFVSISLHRSRDGRRIVNYIQWRSRELLQSAHHSPEFRAEWRHFDDLTREIEPQLYDVVLVMDGETTAAARKQTRAADSRKTAHRRRTTTRAGAARKAARARAH
jgi:heme-degrading monooxygenase HmoA